MGNTRAMLQTLKISEVKSRFSSLVNEVHRSETRILVEKAGVPVAALVPIKDLQQLDRLDTEWAERTAALEAFGAAFQDVPTDELEREIARIIAEGPEPDVVEAERQPA